MHCHHRQRSGYRWICTIGKTRQISSLPLIAINSLLILPKTKSAFDNCNYLRHREPKKSPWLRSPANTSVRQNYSCDYWWNFYHPLHRCPLLHKHSFKFPYSRHYSTSHYIDQPGKKPMNTKQICHQKIEDNANRHVFITLLTSHTTSECDRCQKRVFLNEQTLSFTTNYLLGASWKREGRLSQARAWRSTPQSSQQRTETEVKPKRTHMDIWLPHIPKRHHSLNYNNKLYSILNFKSKRSGQVVLQIQQHRPPHYLTKIASPKWKCSAEEARPLGHRTAPEQRDQQNHFRKALGTPCWHPTIKRQKSNHKTIPWSFHGGCGEKKRHIWYDLEERL